MNGFYVSMIFLGILFVITSMVFLLFDKRKAFEFSKSFDEKKQELAEIISDAEQMIEELNKFSDYIVNQVDIKSEQLDKNLKDAETRIHELSEKAAAISASVAAAVNAEKSPAAVAARKMDIQPVIPPVIQERRINGGLGVPDAYAAAAEKNEKVIPFRNKYSEVLRLSREGMGNLDIAKSLNIGKGEVELIVGLRK
ncbi:MAG: DUF6115 domain-containing protein [Bacillota bacterium]